MVVKRRRCPQCGMFVSGLGGQTKPCPSCGAAVGIPDWRRAVEARPLVATAPPRIATAVEPPPAPAAASGRRRGRLILVAFLLLLTAAGAATWRMAPELVHVVVPPTMGNIEGRLNLGDARGDHGPYTILANLPDRDDSFESKHDLNVTTHVDPDGQRMRVDFDRIRFRADPTTGRDRPQVFEHRARYDLANRYVVEHTNESGGRVGAEYRNHVPSVNPLWMNYMRRFDVTRHAGRTYEGVLDVPLEPREQTGRPFNFTLTVDSLGRFDVLKVNTSAQKRPDLATFSYDDIDWPPFPQGWPRGRADFGVATFSQSSDAESPSEVVPDVMVRITFYMQDSVRPDELEVHLLDATGNVTRRIPWETPLEEDGLTWRWDDVNANGLVDLGDIASFRPGFTIPAVQIYDEWSQTYWNVDRIQLPAPSGAGVLAAVLGAACLAAMRRRTS